MCLVNDEQRRPHTVLVCEVTCDLRRREFGQSRGLKLHVLLERFQAVKHLLRIVSRRPTHPPVTGVPPRGKVGTALEVSNPETRPGVGHHGRDDEVHQR